MMKFSIITPTYNRLASNYIKECIKSIQGQMPGEYTYEHIIVDDGSTDKTVDYLGKEAKKDARIKVISQKNAGPAKSWQTGIKAATGEFVTFLDDDDILTKDSLRVRAEYISKNPAVDWFIAKAKRVNEDGTDNNSWFQTEYYEEFMYERMLISNTIHSGTPVIKTTACNVVWPEWLERSQDYFFWLEQLRPERKLRLGYIDKEVIVYRVHDQAYTESKLNSSDGYNEKEKLNQRIRQLHNPSLAFLAQSASNYKNDMGLIFNSRSWKTTKPLRFVTNKLKKDKGYTLHPESEKLMQK